jgi:spore coat polysaccharide biosynthesis predicted glycosyltransferase SpsG
MTRVGIRCDAGQLVGVGHLVRCVALAEELLARDVEVVFFGDLGGLDWAHAQLTERGLPLRAAPADLVHAARDLDAVVLDGYHLPAGTGAALRAAGVRVLSVVDGEYGDQEADLVLDQNLGSEEHEPPAVGTFLGGVRFALLRDSVRRHRPDAPRVAQPVEKPTVFCFFGGTDAYDAAPTVVPLLLRTGLPMTVRVVAPRAENAERLRALPLATDQQVQVLGPVDDLGAEVVAADLVISASGTSTWELCCLGATAGLVAVTANQVLGYDRTLALDVAAGVGHLEDLRTPEGAAAAVQVLAGLFSDPVRRTELAARAWAAVDGRGRERVADALIGPSRAR